MMLADAAPGWQTLDTWIVVIGAMSAVACSLCGSFLVLRRMSMMGDAISHAVLPGLAAAFLISGSRDPVIMFGGAVVIGVLTAFFTEWIRRAGRVDEGASMGVVFTILFAAGLILIRRAADHVDLDPECVLYGAIENAPLRSVTIPAILGLPALHLPPAILTNGAILLLNVLFVTLLFKELRIAAFDPALATTVGINARFMHYLLMVIVAITTVAAFESVGSILVIAMLIVPPAAAHLLTERLGVMLVFSAALAAISAVVGHWLAIHAPGWIGYPGVSTNTAGMMGVTAGLLFVLALLLAPRHGLVRRWLARTPTRLA